MTASLLAWIDLETTGVDEHLDPILEVGLVVTEMGQDRETKAWLKTIASSDVVVRPTGTNWLHRLADNDVVLKMHTGNGLIEDVHRSSALPIGEAQERLIRTLAEFGHRHDFMLAGSGVAHFDRRFIAAQMPDLNRWFTYPVLDVGVIRRTLSIAGRDDLIPPLNDDKPHRALADIRLHIAEARTYLALIASVHAPEGNPCPAK